MAQIGVLGSHWDPNPLCWLCHVELDGEIDSSPTRRERVPPLLVPWPLAGCTPHILERLHSNNPNRSYNTAHYEKVKALYLAGDPRSDQVNEKSQRSYWWRCYSWDSLKQFDKPTRNIKDGLDVVIAC